MAKIILTQGLPASGKSSWARQQVVESPGKFVRVNRDDIRRMMHNYKFSKANEQMVTVVRDAAIMAGLKAGRNVIVDETSLNPKVREEMENIIRSAKSQGIKVELEIKKFNKSLEDCIRDDAGRDHPVGKQVILDMYNRWMKEETEPIVYDPNKPDCFICDLDGTIADMGDRNPYNASTCENDAPREHVVHLVDGSTRAGLRAIFVSGRDDEFMPQTHRWLERHVDTSIPRDRGIDPPFILLMRKTGDKRNDSIVKEEILRRDILPFYNVKFCIDDRPSVIRLWRRLGIPVFDVGEGIDF